MSGTQAEGPTGAADAADAQVVTAGHVEQGGGGHEGRATFTGAVAGRVASRGGHPGAVAVLDEASAKVVAFEFDTGDELREHAARHPVVIQVLRGRVAFTVQGETRELVPGELLHLTPMLKHAVTGLEPSTLSVTMLLPHSES